MLMRLEPVAPIWAILLLHVALVAGCATNPPDRDGPDKDGDVALITSQGPAYPPDMEKQGETGFVSLDCTITSAGQAEDCIVTKATNAEFSEAARTYIAHARYRPAVRDGVPVAVAHHGIAIRFKLPPKRIRLVYDCSVTAAGHAGDCREISDEIVPAVLENIVLDELKSLPLMADKGANGTGGEARRKIEALMEIQLDPQYGFTPPTLSTQRQVDFILACQASATLQCKQVSELPFSTASQSYRDERFTAVSIGFNGVLSAQD